MSTRIEEAKRLLAEFGPATLNLPNNTQQCARLREEARQKAQALNDRTIKEQRDFTPEEELEYNTQISILKATSVRIADYEKMTGYRLGDTSAFKWGAGEAAEAAKASAGEFQGILKSVTGWMRGEVLASDSPLHIQQSPSLGLAAAIPTEVLDALPTYYANDAFARAGSTLYQTDDTVPLVRPIIQAGADADTFVEGTSSTESHPFDVESFTFGGTKYSRLVKVSEVALMNSALDLAGEIVAELGASVINTLTKAHTTALITALHSNSSCFVSQGLDHYDTMLSLTLAVPQRFQNPRNAFMLSRADLKIIKNVRSLQNEPLFDPESGTILGYPFVINDNLTRVVFGNWAAGAYVRKTPFFLQRLIELYSENGEIGFKATQFADAKFLASVSAVTTQPLFYSSVETAGS